MLIDPMMIRTFGPIVFVPYMWHLSFEEKKVQVGISLSWITTILWTHVLTARARTRFRVLTVIVRCEINILLKRGGC